MPLLDLFKNKCELCKKCAKKIGEESESSTFSLGDGTVKMWFFSKKKYGIMEEMVRHLQKQIMDCNTTCQGCREEFARDHERTLLQMFDLNHQYLNEIKDEIEAEENARVAAEKEAELLKQRQEEWEIQERGMHLMNAAIKRRGQTERIKMDVRKKWEYDQIINEIEERDFQEMAKRLAELREGTEGWGETVDTPRIRELVPALSEALDKWSENRNDEELWSVYSTISKKPTKRDFEKLKRMGKLGIKSVSF